MKNPLNRYNYFSVINKALLYLILYVSLYYVVIFFYITFSRIDYPFSLEWMEGTSIVQVDRLLDGKSLYVEPSIYYVPLIYPPLYYYISAVFVKLFGFGFLPLRLVSLLATVGIFITIYFVLRLLRVSLIPSLISVGFFAATFDLGGGWFDVARVDMLAIFFLTLGVLFALFDDIKGDAVSGILLAASCLTKQSFLICTLILLFYFTFTSRRYRGMALSSFALFYIVISLWFYRSTSGWYYFYIYELPAGHLDLINFESLIQIVYSYLSFIASFFTDFVGAYIGAVVLFFILLHQKKYNILFLISTLLFAFSVLSWAGKMNQGGYLNVLIPFFVILSIILGISVEEISKISNKYQYRFINILICGVLFYQFYTLHYNIFNHIPTNKDLSAGESLLQAIQAQEGDVFIPFHTEMPLFVGKQTFANWVALAELKGEFGGGSKREWRKVLFQLTKLLEAQKLNLIIIDNKKFWGGIEKFYNPTTPFFEEPDVFWPVTGWQIRPTTIYIPR